MRYFCVNEHNFQKWFTLWEEDHSTKDKYLIEVPGPGALYKRGRRSFYSRLFTSKKKHFWKKLGKHGKKWYFPLKFSNFENMQRRILLFSTKTCHALVLSTHAVSAFEIRDYWPSRKFRGKKITKHHFEEAIFGGMRTAAMAHVGGARRFNIISPAIWSTNYPLKKTVWINLQGL